MNIHHQAYLWLLLIIPICVYILYKRKERINKRFERFAEGSFYAFYMGSRSPFYGALKLSLIILALVAIIIALARPQWDYESKDFEAAGLDIMLAIDVSKSMDATDMLPSRLIRAKMQISAFLEKLGMDRVGIIAFAGDASLECPLTDDYESLRMIVNSLNSDTVPKLGTDIAKAMELALEAFGDGAGSRILIIISDGEDLENSAIQRAAALRSKGIAIYTMGVGSEAGTTIRHPIHGATATTKLDVETLKKIAATGGGEFYAVTPGQNEIRYLLERIYSTEKGNLYNRNISVMKEQYHIFAIFAILMLLIEPLFSGLYKANKEERS